jgi:hypothetical protein
MIKYRDRPVKHRAPSKQPPPPAPPPVDATKVRPLHTKSV